MKPLVSSKGCERFLPPPRQTESAIPRKLPHPKVHLRASSSTHGIRFADCPSLKAFSNQTSAGQLLRAYNTATQRFLQELEDHVQDLLINA